MENAPIAAVEVIKFERKGLKRKPVKKLRTRAKKKTKKVPERRLKVQLEALQKQITVLLYGTDCYTCTAKNLQGPNRQLGHVPWPRSVLSTQAKFDYRFTRIQCFLCNIHRGGMGGEAYRRMSEETDVLSLRNFN